MGHARALLALDDPKAQIRIFNEIITQGYSVRKVEEIVKSLSAGETIESGGKKISPKVQALRRIYVVAGSPVQLFRNKGTIVMQPEGKRKNQYSFR